MAPEDPPQAESSEPGIPAVLNRLDEVLDKLDTILGNMDISEDEPQESGGL